MKEWLIAATEVAIVVIDAMALSIIVVATAAAFFAVVRRMLSPSAPGYERRAVWLRYARWLVAGLTFQLAADIIESSIIETWESVGRLAAIAVIRTFLDYFLERDIGELRERQQERAADSRAPTA